MTPLEYKTTPQFLLRADIEEIDRVLFALMPTAQFGFVSFTEEDIQQGTITYLLYDGIPELIPVTLPRADLLPMAMEILHALNTHIEWEIVGNLEMLAEADHKPCTVFLKIERARLFVDEDGMLEKIQL